MILLERKRVSAHELAGMFEVSERTIYRDIESINLAGIPVCAVPGVGGGIEILPSYKVDKKVFSKIKNNPDYHPTKLTAMCLCVGAELNEDETRDLLARAGYALSPCDKTDVIFKYFIEHEIYDMIELDIQLEEHGLKCIIA